MKKLSVVFSALILLACGGNDEGTSGKIDFSAGPDVRVHELSDAQMLNPVNYSDATAGYILSNIFQQLLSIDFKTLDLVPVLAKSRPDIVTTPEGKLHITYELRDEATWDDGTPITAKDVEFSLKVIKCPKVDNMNNKPYFEFIEDMIFYPENPKKFTFVCKEVYILSEAMSGDIPVLPSKVYDPENILSKYTVKDFATKFEELSSNPDIMRFASNFNSEKYQREKDFIKGSGAYELEEWITGQKIVLKRKQNWWGDKVKENRNIYFEANPPKLIYQTINDQTTALVALKKGDIDVMQGIKPKDFSELPNSSKFTENFNAYTPFQLAYVYVGINMRNPKFSDVKTRQALAHLFDIDRIIKVINYGYAEPAVGPIHPSKKDEFNPNIKPYPFDVAKAKQLLQESGWTDTDNDGILDKTIDGKKVPFETTIIYNSGNDTRKAICLMFQEVARQVGIKVNVQTLEWSIFLDKTKNHDFDMYVGAWISTPIPTDHKQIFHTESYNGGSNYVGFGNDYTDSLINQIRVTLDVEKRKQLQWKFQEILHEQVPYIFLYYPKERLAIHKRFDNAEPSVMRPGYREAAFKLKQLQ